MKRKILFNFLLLFVSCFIFGCKGCSEDYVDGDCEHENLEWVVFEDSTCTKLGTKKQICSDCGKIITTAAISIKDHTVVTDNGYDSTCTTSGLTEGSHCSVCNTVMVKQEEISPKGHNYQINEDLSNDSVLVYKCLNCGDSYEKENTSGSICTDGHNLTGWITFVEPTCYSLGKSHIVCLDCLIEVEIKELEYAPHTESKKVGIAPGCTISGLTDGTICSVCDKVLKEQTVIEALGHNYQITSTVKPTEEEAGYVEYTCSRCNDSYKNILSSVDSYNPAEPTIIILSDDEITIGNDNGGVIINSSQVTINLAGEYDLIGEISDGSVVVALEETDRATINLKGVSITSKTNDPIYIESGDKVEISAKSETLNYINDERSLTTADAVGGGIYSKIDLEIKGKGSLYITSSYNNGVSTTKDLKVKNLNLEVNAVNNALKGNDSITIESGTIKAISSSSDALKTSNSDVSEKGNQRGIITILDGELNLYAACDGIDASYDVVINGGTINIYTEKYSSYSGDVTVSSSTTAYIRISSRASGLNNISKYSAQYILEDRSTVFVNGTYVTNFNKKYYSFNVPSNAKYVKYYAYNSSQTQGQSTSYAYATDQLTITSAYDTYYINSISGTKLAGQWENYNSPSGGMGGPGGMGGGMNEGNPNSSTYSCKGIKADNSITIKGGSLNIKSHDDAIHTNSDVQLANGSYGTASLTITGGDITIYTDDDALHSDGTLTIEGGNIIINNSYEGVEGNYIYFKSGIVQIKSLDDGINAKTTLYFQGSTVYLDAGGDGLDSNGNIYMSAGVVLALGPTNGGNGVIDYGDRNASFSFSGGLLLAIGCSGMNAKPTASSGNTVNATTISTSVNSYLTITSNGEVIAVVKVTKSNQNYRVFAYNNSEYPSSSVTSSNSTSYDLVNGLYYIGK